jgi:hypothetical protein
MVVTLKRFLVLLVLGILFLGAAWFGIYLNRTSPLEWTKEALRPWEKDAFEVIGNQGIKTNVSLSELEGHYQGDLILTSADMQGQSFSVNGQVHGNSLTLSWQNTQGETTTIEQKFSLLSGVLRFENNSADQKNRYFGVVKVYPSNHMLDLLFEVPLSLEVGVDSSEKWHFQIIKE